MLEADTAPNLPGLVIPVRPVLVTLLPHPLLDVSKHHNHRDSLLNDYLPEVSRETGLGAMEAINSFWMSSNMIGEALM